MGGERSLAPEGTPFTSTDVSPADLPTRRTLLPAATDGLIDGKAVDG
jgi:hypothetical protein